MTGKTGTRPPASRQCISISTTAFTVLPSTGASVPGPAAPPLIFASTNDAVYVSRDLAATWSNCSLGLPACPQGADIQCADGPTETSTGKRLGGTVLYLGTWGRSVWTASLKNAEAGPPIDPLTAARSAARAAMAQTGVSGEPHAGALGRPASSIHALTAARSAAGAARAQQEESGELPAEAPDKPRRRAEPASEAAPGPPRSRSSRESPVPALPCGNCQMVCIRTCSATRSCGPADSARAITGDQARPGHEIRVIKTSYRSLPTVQQLHLHGVLSRGTRKSQQLPSSQFRGCLSRRRARMKPIYVVDRG